MTKPVIYSKTINRKVLFGECDPAGIVYTPRFADFSLEAVHDVFDAIFNGKGIQKLLKLNVLLPVKAIAHEFIAPVSWGDNLSITVNLVKVGKHSASFELRGDIVANNLNDETFSSATNEATHVHAFTSSMTLVFMCANSKRKVAVPAELLSVLNISSI